MKDKLVESLVEQCVAYRGWMVEQLKACIRNYEAADATKKEKAHAWTARMFLQGGIAEFDRRVNVREAASRLAEGTREDLRQPDDAMLTAQITKLTRYISERQDRGIECPDHVDIRTLLIEYRALLSTPPASPAATSAQGCDWERPRDYSKSAAERPAQTCATCNNYEPKLRGGFCLEWGARDVPSEGFCYKHAPRSVVAPEKE